VRNKSYFHNEFNGIGQLGKTKGVLNALYSGPREASSAAEGYINATVTLIKNQRQGSDFRSSCGNLHLPSVYNLKGECLGLDLSIFDFVPNPISLQPHCIYRIIMRGLSLAPAFIILVLSSTLAFAAPGAAVNVLEGDLNVRSASCKIHGTCSVFNTATCCGTCILITDVAVSQRAFSQQVLIPQHIFIDFLIMQGYCQAPSTR
jgi:hypothetical protein